MKQQIRQIVADFLQTKAAFIASAEAKRKTQEEEIRCRSCFENAAIVLKRELFPNEVDKEVTSYFIEFDGRKYVAQRTRDSVELFPLTEV